MARPALYVDCDDAQKIGREPARRALLPHHVARRGRIRRGGDPAEHQSEHERHAEDPEPRRNENDRSDDYRRRDDDDRASMRAQDVAVQHPAQQERDHGQQDEES